MDLVYTNLKISGKLGSLVYYESKQHGFLQKLTRTYFLPNQPGSQSQLSNWSRFACAVCSWQQLSADQKKYYSELSMARGRQLPGYNFFISEYMRGRIVMVKNVQQGNNIVVHGITDITISAVDLTKSVVLVDQYNFWIGLGMANLFCVYSAFLFNSTTLRIICNKGANIGTVYLSWQVVEYC